jgi:hypothetical protein
VGNNLESKSKRLDIMSMNNNNKAILIGIIAAICIGLLIAGIIFPALQPETKTKQEDIIPQGTPLTTFDDTVVEPGSNKVSGLTNEDWFSELLDDEELNFFNENIGESEFNTSGDGDRNDDQDGTFGGDKSSTDMGAEDSSPEPPSDQKPRDIEEADIIKLVDDTLYILNTYRGFMVIDVSDPDEPYIKSRVPLFGHPVEMYVVEPKAYVILTHYYNTFLWAEDGDAEPQYMHGSEIVIIDISDLTAPTVEQYIELEGFITDSRRVGEVIYAVVNNFDHYYGFDTGFGIGVPRDAVLEGGDFGRGEIVEEEAKSDSESKEAEEDTATSSEPVPPPDDEEYEEEIIKDEITDDDDEEYIEEDTEGTIVISINFEDLTNVFEVDREMFPGTSNQIHVTEDSIFIAQPGYDYIRDSFGSTTSVYYTEITYVDISDYHGDIKIRDTFKAEGFLNDRYQMDYYQDTFRIVTHFWGEWGQLGESKLWVFDTSDPDDITKKGELLIDDAGSLMATRFAGERAYTIHLPYSVDPLDVIDLSDPSKPVLTDVFEMPGWVTHMEVRGYKILALGVDDSGDHNKVAVSLFDVSDPYKAEMEARVMIGEGTSWSTANWDPKALTVVDDQNLVLVPFESYSYDKNGKSSTFTGLQIVQFDLEAGKLTLGGTIEQMGSVQRTRANSERIFALSYRQLQVIDATNRGKPRITATLELANSIIDILPMGDYCVQVISDYDYSKGTTVTKLRTVDSDIPDTSVFVAEKIIGYNVNKLLINDDLIYIVGSKYIEETYQQEGWILIFDYSDPTKPVKKSEFEMEYYQGNYYGYYWYYYDWYGGYNPRGAVLEQSFALVGGDLLVYHPQAEQYYYDYPEDDVVYDEGGSTDPSETNKSKEEPEEPNSENKTVPEEDPEKEPEPSVERREPYYYNKYSYNEMFYFIDLSNPSAPKDAGNLSMENTSRVSGMHANGDSLFIVQYEDTSYYDEYYNWNYQVKYYLTHLDIDNPSEPAMGTPINIPGTFLGMSDDQSVVYTKISEYDENNNWKQTLNVLHVDVDSGKAVLKSALDLGDDYPSIMIQDTTIILSYYNYDYYYYDDIYDGAKVKESNSLFIPEVKTKVHIIDASNPASLKLKATIGLKQYGSVYTIENNKLYLQLSDTSGLVIYDISDLTKPDFKGYFPTYGNINSLREDTSTGKIYLACGLYGVLLVELE